MNTTKWEREINIFSKIKTAIVLEKNLFDVYPFEVNGKLMFSSLDRFIYENLLNKGYRNIIFYDPLNGFYNRYNSNFGSCLMEIMDCSSMVEKNDDYLGVIFDPQDILSASIMIKQTMINNPSVAIIMSYASRYCTIADQLEEKERKIFMNLLYGAMNSKKELSENSGIVNNIIFLLVDKVNDIPSWFFLENPYQKTITIPIPNKDARLEYIAYRKNEFFGYDAAKPNVKNDFCDTLAKLTEGLRCVEIDEIKNLYNKEVRVEPNNNEEDYILKKIIEIVALYKYGVKDNPWLSISKEVLIGAEDVIRKRVIGQDIAVEKSVNIIKRAALGLSGLQHSSSNSKPRGIMFFAGPTGTGKTETAKALANILFETDDACIRFDMSEYSEDHSDQKLFGAPPGYVGYLEGGQLTNAVKEHPFSILLFDEIEKAAPSIFDKFLQVLEDGRMTDSQGNTVYFSETLIIFTSNLGLYKTDARGEYILDCEGNRIPNVKPNDSYEHIQNEVISAIEKVLKPELLNRIGDNIIVFNYIDNEQACKILEEKQIPNIKSFFKKEKGIDIEFTENAMEILRKKAIDKVSKYGGRGVGNVVETFIINPLSKLIYEIDLETETSIVIHDFKELNGTVTIECRE